jgi:hypothetical protein
MKTCIIVAGAAGELGTEFCRVLAERTVDVVAVVRNRKLSITSPCITEIGCDLTDSVSIEKAFTGLDLSKYDHIIFLHTIGTDKFDPRGYPNISKMSTIDPDVYDTNVNTFKYPLRYLVATLRKINAGRPVSIHFKAVLVGGVPDKYGPFVIEGFCEAKNLCREYIRSAITLNQEWVCGLAVNITSMVTKSACSVRPFADLTHWLVPEEVVEQSIGTLMAHAVGFNEIEIIKRSPEFKEGYYEDAKALYEKWSRETGTNHVS